MIFILRGLGWFTFWLLVVLAVFSFVYHPISAVRRIWKGEHGLGPINDIVTAIVAPPVFGALGMLVWMMLHS